MHITFEEKVALVTGAASGVGPCDSTGIRSVWCIGGAR